MTDDLSTFPAEPNPAWDDEPKADAECDGKDGYCGYSCEADGTLGLFVAEVERDGYDVMIYCTCDHHGGAEYIARIREAVGY